MIGNYELRVTNYSSKMRSRPTEVALFITCLADVFFPEVGQDTVWLLREAGLRVHFPTAQTCCGQPPFNAGFQEEARTVARHFLQVFAPYEAIVTPSGSCAMMVRQEYPHLFADEPETAALAESIAARTFELSDFLVNVMDRVDFGASWPGRVSYHDACHLARGLGVREAPRRLLRAVAGLELVEMDEPDWCCGFGGAFAAKQPDISGAMLREKLRRLAAVEAETIATSDGGCILHLNGGIARQGIAGKRLCHWTQIARGRGG